jgi:hypothetical protein
MTLSVIRSCSTPATASASLGASPAPAEQPSLRRHAEQRAALDAQHGRQPGVARDVGRLAGPRRNRAQARNDEELRGAGPRLARLLAVGQQRGEARVFVVFERTRDMDEVNEATLDRLSAGRDAPDPRQQPLRTKWGQRARTREREELTV